MAELNRKKFELKQREDRIRRDTLLGIRADARELSGLTGVLIMTDDQFKSITTNYRQIGAITQVIEDLERVLLKYETEDLNTAMSRSLSMFGTVTPSTQSPQDPDTPS